MKNIFLKFGLVVLCLSSFNTWAQIEDQNPNYEESMNYYFQIKDTLTLDLSTTVQQTYKAYDWYEAREERRALKREYRHLERMNRPYYGYNSYYDYNFGIGYHPSYNTFSFSFPRIGFRIGNFWLSL